MDLEARVQQLEAEVATLRTRVDGLDAAGSRRAPAAPAPNEPSQADLMRSLSERVQEAARDVGGSVQPMIMQAVVDRPGSTFISMATMAELCDNIDVEAIVRLAGILASEPRLRILKALTGGERSAAEVGGAIGLEGGPLYHHLSELQEGGFVTQPSRGRYAMTRRGRDLYYQAALLVRTPYDRPPTELGRDLPPEA